ncbi:Chitin synthase, class 3, partial [Gonapodya sp. JEL0774]
IVQAILLLRSSFALSATQILPLALMVVSILIPTFLVLVTAKRLSYIGWWVLFLLALPVWQIVLPLYAFWHFDDFSWGATRQVAGAGADDHGSGEGEFDARAVPFKRWDEYEKAWRQSLLNKRGAGAGGGTGLGTAGTASEATLYNTVATPTGNRKVPPPRASADVPRGVGYGADDYHDRDRGYTSNEEFVSDDETARLTANAGAYGRAQGQGHGQGRRNFRGAGERNGAGQMEQARVATEGVQGQYAVPPQVAGVQYGAPAVQQPQPQPQPAPPQAPVAYNVPLITVSTPPPRGSSGSTKMADRADTAPQPGSAPPPAPTQAPSGAGPLVPPLLTFTPPSPALSASSPPPKVVNPPARQSSGSVGGAPMARTTTAPPGGQVHGGGGSSGRGAPPPAPTATPVTRTATMPAPTSPTSIEMSVEQLMAGVGGTGAGGSSGRPTPPKPTPTPTSSKPSSGAIDDLMKGW